ncbi:hypothetical protein [Bosea sp. (in: a-proteobacteria)]|uniref:hypothetical protein n=1 Tax=Bosea sp. (in: a-proteobacteria) TaxID=1871050 RepID=UPI001AD59A25|nr:hypothetical protein [Bosea sp. (in: a-proteobacteria)]MBN9437043.1 hypothetical protein [Bosea sp. (in: a-proteobacteria)]
MQAIIEAITSKEGIVNLTPVIFTALIALMARLLAGRTRIRWGVVHDLNYYITEEEKKVMVWTCQIVFINPSKSIAEDIEIVFNYRPLHLSVFPHLKYEISENPDRRIVVKIDKLNPKEIVNIAMLNTHTELPHMTSVRFKGGIGKRIDLEPSRVFPVWIRGLIGFVMLAGVAAIFYVIARLAVSIFWVG